MYFNNFSFNPIGRLVGKDAQPTAFLFQKLGFAGVSIYKKSAGKISKYLSGRLYFGLQWRIVFIF
ncbi:MAG: hypothetical protein IK065_07395 [Neisseriaceae bacterium]|nr:hypothetical protein [Neisseriaceae bacterium]